jgi:hypothetical protein
MVEQNLGNQQLPSLYHYLAVTISVFKIVQLPFTNFIEPCGQDATADCAAQVPFNKRIEPCGQDATADCAAQVPFNKRIEPCGQDVAGG